MLLALMFAVLPMSAPGVDFQNYTYAVTPCNPGPIMLKHGEGQMDVQETTLYLFFEGVVAGQLAPKREYAVVRLSCSFPAGSSSAAYLYRLSDGRAMYVQTLAQVDPGEGHMDHGWIHVRFAHDLLYVDHCASADDCDNGIVTTYALRGGRVKPIFTLRHKYTM